LASIKHWLDVLDPHDPLVAKFIVHMIVGQSPFERDIRIFGCRIVQISPMIQLPPLSEQLVALCLRCLSKLSHEAQLLSRNDEHVEG